MGLVWCEGESEDFQRRLWADLAIWESELTRWRFRLQGLESAIGAGPGAQLDGAAWNAARTFWLARVLPLVESGRRACGRTLRQLEVYSRREDWLLGESGLIREHALQSAVDTLTLEIRDLEQGPSSVTRGIVTYTLTAGETRAGHLRRLKTERRALRRTLRRLRRFSAATNGLFRDEVALVGALSQAIASIGRGSLGADGIYTPAAGDAEKWAKKLGRYLTDHPERRRPVFGREGEYGGNQGSLMDRWWLMSDEQRAVYAAVIRRYFPGLNDHRIVDVVFWMEAISCGFIAGINSIVAHFADDPVGFEARFGFPLYAANGSVNFDRLFTEYWCFVQSRRPGVDPTGRTPGHEPAGTYPAGEHNLEDFLAAHGVTATTTTLWTGSAESYSDLAQPGTTVFASVDPLYFRDATGRLVTVGSGFHAVTITGQGVDSSGNTYWVISSWGKQYRLYPGDYAGTGSFDLNQDGVIDTDTDGDGKPDYQKWVHGKLKTVNYPVRFVIETVSYQ